MSLGALLGRYRLGTGRSFLRAASGPRGGERGALGGRGLRGGLLFFFLFLIVPCEWKLRECEQYLHTEPGLALAQGLRFKGQHYRRRKGQAEN